MLKPLIAQGAADAGARSDGQERPRLAEETHALGWFLGAVGAALGADLFFDRRERRSLALAARCVERAVGEGRHLSPTAQDLPDLAQAGPRHFDPSLALALVLEAHLARLAPGEELGWSAEPAGAGLRLLLATDPLEGEGLTALLGRLAAFPSADYDPGGVTLTLDPTPDAPVGG